MCATECGTDVHSKTGFSLSQTGTDDLNGLNYRDGKKNGKRHKLLKYIGHRNFLPSEIICSFYFIIIPAVV